MSHLQLAYKTKAFGGDFHSFVTFLLLRLLLLLLLLFPAVKIHPRFHACTKQKDNCFALANHVHDTCPLSQSKSIPTYLHALWNTLVTSESVLKGINEYFENGYLQNHLNGKENVTNWYLNDICRKIVTRFMPFLPKQIQRIYIM